MGSRTSWQPVEQAIRRIVVTVGAAGALLAPAACRDSDERSAGTTASPTSQSTDTPAPLSTSTPSTAPSPTPPPTTPPPASIATTTTTEPPLLTPVWTTALAPASSLVATGDVVAFYVGTADERLEIVALGAADGAERWRHPAAVSEIYIGIAPAPVALADRIVALAPRSDGGDGAFVTLHGYDPATGQIAWVSEPFITRNGPGECDDGPHVCMIGYLESDHQTARDLRFDPASGVLVASTPLAEQGDTLSGDLVRVPDGVALVDRATGTFVWTASYGDIFGDRPVNSGYGYVSHFDEPTNTFVLSFGADPAASGDVTRWDVSLVSMAGLDATTGAVKWLEDGVTWLCRVGFHADPRDGVGQRCRQRGIVQLEPTGGTSYSITGATDLATSIEVFDLGTGAMIGTPLDLVLPAGFMNPSAGPTAVFRYPPVDVGDDLVAAVTPAGPAALDLRTGGNHTREPGPGRVVRRRGHRVRRRWRAAPPGRFHDALRRRVPRSDRRRGGARLPRRRACRRIVRVERRHQRVGDPGELTRLVRRSSRPAPRPCASCGWSPRRRPAT